MFKCTILVGVPGSGKSTWLARRLFDRQPEWLVSTDEIIQAIADDHCITYDQAFPDLIKFAESQMWRHLKEAADLKMDIAIDRTNLSRKSRAKFINFLKPYGYSFDAVVFPMLDPVEWQRRLASRPGKTIPGHILDSMVRTFEHPTQDEGFTDVKYV